VNPREIARLLSVGRIAIGVGLVTAPRFWAPVWVGREGLSPAAKLFARALGARDIALGSGALLAMSYNAPVRGWIEGAMLADLADVVATYLQGEEVPRLSRPLVYAIGGGAFLAGAAIAPAVDDSGPGTESTV
jgi:hypothetical protein